MAEPKKMALPLTSTLSDNGSRLTILSRISGVNVSDTSDAIRSPTAGSVLPFPTSETRP